MSAPGKDLAFVNALREALGCQEEVYLVVNLPSSGMSGTSPAKLWGVESVRKGELLAVSEL